MIKTEYCCRLLLGLEWKSVADALDKFITSKSFEEGLDYIYYLKYDEEIKDKLKTCFLSYEKAC